LALTEPDTATSAQGGRTIGVLRRGARFLPPLVFGLGALFLLVHFNLKPVAGDEGVTAVDAWRLLRGEVPQRDYFEIIPPLSAGLVSLFFRFLGLSVASLRAAGLFYGVALLGLTWAVARRFCENPLCQALPLAVLVPFGAGTWPFPSHHWLADLFCLLGLLALLQASESGRPFLWALAAGAAVAGACFTLQDQGGLALLAAALSLLWVDRGKRGRVAAGLALGGLFLALAIGLIWLPLDIPTLWHDWFSFPASHYRRVPDNAVGLWDGLRLLGDQWTSVAFRIAPVHAGAIALSSTLLFTLPLAFLAAAWALWRDREMPRLSWALLVGLAVASLGTALHRWSLMNLIWATPIPMVAVAAALERVGRAGGPRRRMGTAVVVGILLVVFLAAGGLRIAFVLRTRGHDVTGAAGTYRTFSPMEAQKLSEFAGAIESHLSPGEGAFVRGYIPLISFLTLRPNPTPFTYYQPGLGYHTPEQADRWCRSLERGPVRWGFSLDVPLDLTDPADAYLSGRYRVVWRNGVYALWEKVR